MYLGRSSTYPTGQSRAVEYKYPVLAIALSPTSEKYPAANTRREINYWTINFVSTTDRASREIPDHHVCHRFPWHSILEWRGE
jgi:hypothetical protein